MRFGLRRPVLELRRATATRATTASSPPNPRSLFGPLGDRYAELYWELLATLYRCEFEREPFIVLRPVALEIAEQAIRNSTLWTTRRAELEQFARQEENSYGNDGSPEESICRKPATRLESELADENALIRAEALARRLTARLERSGWIHFQNRSGQGEIMSFHPYAARIAETLLRVARDEQPVFEGLVHSIAALLDPRGVCSTSRRAFPSYRAYKNPSRQTDAVRAIPKLTSVDCPRLKRLAINRTDFTVLDGSQVAGNAQFQASEMRTQLAIAHRVQHVRANTITSLVPETVPEETVRVLFAPSDEAFIIIQKKPNTSCEFLFMTEHTPMLRGVAPATY